jgi:hypothetical protein
LTLFTSTSKACPAWRRVDGVDAASKESWSELGVDVSLHVELFKKVTRYFTLLAIESFWGMEWEIKDLQLRGEGRLGYLQRLSERENRLLQPGAEHAKGRSNVWVLI